MIARRWDGMVLVDSAEAYLRLMSEVVLPGYRATGGNRGAWCLSRADGEVVHVEMLTFWDDVAAIRRFAGPDYEAAKYYDFDDGYPLAKEPHVLHFRAVPDVSGHIGSGEASGSGRNEERARREVQE